MRRPLEGIRVLDLTLWQQGTYATAIMADLGADVVKVEEPRSGDPGRYMNVDPNVGLSAYFEAHNRGKRSIAIDLKHTDGRAVLLRLAERADVFLNNYRIGAIERLRLTYDALAAVNPGIVYVQCSGYGAMGDDAGLGSLDILAQARGGFMSMTGEPDGPPVAATVPIGDQVGGMNACIAALAALVERAATGRGARIDVSLLGSQVAMQSFNITTYLFSGQQPPRRARGRATPFWGAYQGRDGRWFVIGNLFDRGWPELAKLIGRPELVEDERFDSYRKRLADSAQQLIAILDEAFLKATAREWVDRLNGIGVLAALVQDYAEVADDPQVIANGYVHDVPREGREPVRIAGLGINIDGEPVRVRRVAPEHGAHTEDVLIEGGYTWDEIAALRASGAVGPRAEDARRAAADGTASRRPPR